MRRMMMLCALAILTACGAEDTVVQHAAPAPQPTAPQPTAPAPIDYGKYWQEQMLYNIGSYGP